jgi:hypothetical protein
MDVAFRLDPLGPLSLLQSVFDCDELLPAYSSRFGAKKTDEKLVFRAYSTCIGSYGI